MVFAVFEERGSGSVVGAEPANGGNAAGVTDDPIDEVAGFGAEVVFGGGEDADIFVRGVLGDEETGAMAGDIGDRSTAAVEERIARACMVVDDNEGAVV